MVSKVSTNVPGAAGMPSGAEFVMSEVIDFAFENPLYITCVALVSFYVGLEVSGHGIICKYLHQKRVKKWNEDLVRVRELQDQLSVLRSVRAKRKQEAARKKAEAAKPKDADRAVKPKKEAKVRFSSNDVTSVFSDQATSDPETVSPAACVDEAAVDTSIKLDEAEADAKPAAEVEKSISEENNETEDEFGEIPRAASDVYESVKDAWSWGRHETPLSPLLGLAEGITVKTASIFGTDMKGIDDALKPHVAGLDGHVANILHGINNNDNKEPEEEKKEES
ncbi:expressed unknown protein [Seminavis robusta]|uniref:Uncharacterized protein n=1 Tax=Seminavis robusta TaxID=568900 RepID=A0A9N8E4L8_9STRA|nr:expressed unknown protein [Seminavis robusta]|eukprot:Sro495_g154500.1 n/a (280) ;mRNA; r:37828-38827